eukprot:TRINITY_DN22995_c0_g1_i1.p1 TRINITY_DN22995_c0_g1~~TRINITY_DN22995_c0_g1_i1.p1  ORF type:complete len:421 (+),score=153.23 TRINITY_DN22995_c0_g1_i1:82-1263(+)
MADSRKRGHSISKDPRFADLGEPIQKLLLKLAEGGDGVDDETVAMLTHVGVRQLAKVYEMLGQGADPETILAWLKQRAREARDRKEKVQRAVEQAKQDPRLEGVVPCVIKLSESIQRPATDDECDLARQWMSESYVSVPEMATIADSIEQAGDPVKAWDNVMDALRQKRLAYRKAERAAAEDALALARKAPGFGGEQRIGTHQETDDFIRAAIRDWFDNRSELGRKGFRISDISALYRNNGWEVSAAFAYKSAKGGSGGEDFRRFVYDPVTRTVVAMDGRQSGSKRDTKSWNYGPAAQMMSFQCVKGKHEAARKAFAEVREASCERDCGLRSMLFWLSEKDGRGGAQLLFENQEALEADSGSEGVTASVLATLRARGLLQEGAPCPCTTASVC